MTKIIEAWDISPGVTIRYKHWGKTLEGIVLKVQDRPRDRMFITLTSGSVECNRSSGFELVEVK